MQSHVFVSYVHEDAVLVSRLCSDLQKVGVKVWLDKNELMLGVR